MNQSLLVKEAFGQVHRNTRHKSKPRHWGGVRTPILLDIPHLVWTLTGGLTPGNGHRVTKQHEAVIGGAQASIFPTW